MRAYVLLTTKPGTAADVVKRMRGMKEAIWADWFYGRFDAMVIVVADEAQLLDDFIHKVVLKDPDVTHAETLIALHEDVLQEMYAKERLKSLGIVE